LSRFIATAMTPILDVVIFCVLMDAGSPLRASHIASFAVAMTLNYLLKVRSTIVAQGRTADWRLHGRLLTVALAALFLRGGVLALLTSVWTWPAQASIVIAMSAGWMVAALGYSQVLSSDEHSARSLCVGVVLYAVALRLVYAATVELLPEETYYWNYSRHLDIGYLDHPPMVAWLIKAGTSVFGQSQFGVRIGAVCCGMLMSFFIYRLTRNLFGAAVALAALVLSQILPFFFLSGFLMTPDAPLAVAWAATLYFLERALIADRPKAWWGAGIALGIGFVSKYSIGLLVPATLLFMVWDRLSHPWWRRWEPYAAALLALAIFSPVILWNAQHGWASFEFQTLRRLADIPRFSLHRLILSALVLITPTGVLAVAAVLSSWNMPGARSDPDASRRKLLLSLVTLLPLSVFAIFSLRHEIKLDWTGAPWVGALPVMAVSMLAGAGAHGRRGGGGEPSSRFRAWIQTTWRPTLVALLLFYGAGLQYLALGLPGVGYAAHNELIPAGWRSFGRQITQAVAQFRRATGRDPLIVGMDRYAIASELAFYGAEAAGSAVQTSSAHLFQGVGLMYERWTPRALQNGRDLLLIAWDPNDLRGKAVESQVERLGPIEEHTLWQEGQMVRHYYRRFAYNYRQIPRP
jgi:dolichol-phosphate mannosyltransferase